MRDYITPEELEQLRNNLCFWRWMSAGLLAIVLTLLAMWPKG